MSQSRAFGVFRFVAALHRTAFSAALALRGAFLLQVAFMAANNLTFFVFWWLLYQQVPDIRGYSLGDMAVLYGVVAVAFGLSVALFGGAGHLGRLIVEGELDPLLTQPKPTLLYALGMRSQASGIGDVASGLVLLALSGRIDAGRVPLVAVAVLASALVFTATGTLFFSSAFWLGKTDGIARLLWEVVLTFSLYPEPIFGGAVRVVLLTLLPAVFVGHLPARLVQHASWGDLTSLLGAAAVYVTAAVWVFGRGLHRYSSGSRFSVLG